MPGLTREDSSTISFVVACYFTNAIDTGELRGWGEHVIASGAEYPAYFLELIDFDQPRFHLYEVLGFVPGRELTARESDALSGIAYLRDRQVHDGPPRDRAVGALRSSPHILAEFGRTFPFLEPVRVPE